MRVLVTGACGFIGTHVCKMLPETAEVMRVDMMEPRVHGANPDPEADFFWNVPAGWLNADLLEDFDPSVIIHLGAQVGVADSMDDPWRYFKDNSEDTLLFLEALRTARIKPRRFVVASSMSVYGDPGTRDPIDESAPVAPASIYGLTKFDQEAMCLMYGKMLGIPTAALRFWNVYGPGQALHNPYTGVLAIFANALLAGRNPTVYEDGLQTRDFVHVEDVAAAVVGMTLDTVASGVFNVATGVPTTIYDVARMLARELGRPDLAPHVTHETRPGDVRHAIGDATRLRETLPKWTARSFEEGVRSYAEFLKERYG